MKTIIFAYQNIGCIGLKALKQNGFEIKAVFTHKDNPLEKIWFDSVTELAASENIPVYAPEDINHPIWVQKIREIGPDIIFSFYYRKMISPEILNIPASGCLNLHGSLLPAYRGRCPVNWVLINGEKKTGVTLHKMTPRPDDGDIICQQEIIISKDETAKSLHAKAASAASEMLAETLPLLKNGNAPHRPQDHSSATYFGGRHPGDGEIDWTKTAKQIDNLVRAVSQPYPGAFSYIGNRKCIFWKVRTVDDNSVKPISAGTVISTDPLVIACGRELLTVEFGQSEKGIYLSGNQLALELALVKGMKFGQLASGRLKVMRKKRVLILGVDGFIGNALTEKLLDSGKYEVHGMDLHTHSIKRFFGTPGFHFHEGDISIHREWIEYHIKKCDIVLPLVAIATPIEYTRNPLRVFELDFEENLRIIRHCVKYHKRVLFPSTSEVYGMCDEENFDEENSNLVLGPIRMQRWIYSCSKQLLDRVIWAYGEQEGLQFTLFRPFNWIGPRLDSLSSARIGSSRAITQLILNLVEGTPIQLFDGGNQKRCFTDISDGIECLFRIIENKNKVCDSRIINIGNPDNEASIKDLAKMLVKAFEKHPLRSQFPPFAGVCEVESGSFYGAGYQDVEHRKPSILNAWRLLNWSPSVELEQAVEDTLDFFLHDAINSGHNKSLSLKKAQSENFSLTFPENKIRQAV